MLYNNDYADALDLDDARKVLNFSSENFGIDNGGQWLQIEKRTAIHEEDTIRYKMRYVKLRNYRLQVSASGIETAGVSAFLEDNYLHSSTLLTTGSTLIHHFAINQDSASFNSSRFRIVFRRLTVVPVHFVSVKGNSQPGGIHLHWTVANEAGVKAYTVERSADGIHFTSLFTETAPRNSGLNETYHWLDVHPLQGANYYRVRSLDITGAEKRSETIRLLYNNKDGDITLYPNPLVNEHFQLNFLNQVAGRYRVRLLTETGLELMSNTIEHHEGDSLHPLKTRQALLHGSYRLEIILPGGGTKTIQLVY